VASAAITGFGSVYVNGPHFRTSSAIIRKNGKTVEHSRLAVREIARVKGPKGDADNTGIELTGSNSTLQVLGTAASLYTAARVLPVVGREDLRRRTRRSESGSTCTKKKSPLSQTYDGCRVELRMTISVYFSLLEVT